MKKGTIVFDFDGTLHQTAALYGCAFRTGYEMLVLRGYAKPREYSDEEVSKYLGMTADDMWKDFMPELPFEVKEEAKNIISQSMDSQIAEGKAKLFEHTAETLDALKADGYELVILSNCRHKYLEEHRSFFNLDRWFCAYYAAQDYNLIPKEEIFKFVKKEHQGPFVMVGDRDSDVKAGKDNSAFTVGCLFGYGTREELAECDYCIKDMSELYSVIALLFAK